MIDDEMRDLLCGSLELQYRCGFKGSHSDEVR